MDIPLGKGIFLVARPSLRDPNFRQTVILLCEHGPEGALGVVVNRQTEINITEVLPQVPILEGQHHKVFSGGPVQKNNLLILYRTPEGAQDSHHVFNGIYLGGNMKALEDLVQDPSSLGNFRAFMGYSGWRARPIGKRNANRVMADGTGRLHHDVRKRPQPLVGQYPAIPGNRHGHVCRHARRFRL